MNSISIPIRWRDCDALGHVNSAVFLTLLEEGRDRWLEATLGDYFGPEQYVLARIELDYQRQIPAGTRQVSLEHHCVAVGNTSVTIDGRIHDGHQSMYATSLSVIVLWDPVARVPRGVTTTERAALQPLALAP